MNPILAVVLTSLLVSGTACSGARASGESPRTTAIARHAAQGDSPWLEDAPSRYAASDEAPAASSGDESDSSDGDDLGDEGSDDFGEEGGDDGGGEDGSETTIEFGDEEWGGEEDWEDEEDQGSSGHRS